MAGGWVVGGFPDDSFFSGDSLLSGNEIKL